MMWEGGGKCNLIATDDKKMKNENENLSKDKNRLIIFLLLRRCSLFFVDVVVARWRLEIAFEVARGKWN